MNKSHIGIIIAEAQRTKTPAEQVRFLSELLAQPYIVEYAYATSETASIYGMSRTGCYFVSGKDGNKPRYRASSHGYKTPEEAQAVADVLSNTESCAHGVTNPNCTHYSE